MNNEKSRENKSFIENEYLDLESIVISIVSDDSDFNTGLDHFSSILYDKDFSTFWRSSKLPWSENNRKSHWYTKECDTARRELRSINKNYNKNMKKLQLCTACRKATAI